MNLASFHFLPREHFHVFRKQPVEVCGDLGGRGAWLDRHESKRQILFGAPRRDACETSIAGHDRTIGREARPQREVPGDLHSG